MYVPITSTESGMYFLGVRMGSARGEGLIKRTLKLSSTTTTSSSSLTSTDQELKSKPASFTSSTTSPPPLTSTDHELISKAASFLKHLRSSSKWNQLRSLYPEGVPPSHSSQIILLLRNTPRLAIRFFHWTRSTSATTHTLLSFSAVIHIAARARLRSHTISLAALALRSSHSDRSATHPPPLFHTLASTYRTYHSSPFVFEWLILACLRSSLPHQALSVLRSLRRNSISPRLSTVSLLIRSFSRSLGPHAGYDVFREIFQGEEGVLRPDLDIFNGMMACFGEEGVVEGVEMVMEEMRRSFGCEPDGYSRSILMAAYCGAGRMEEAERVFEEEEKPDVVAFNCMMGGFFRRGEVEKGVGVFERMGRRGVEGNRVTYQKVINGYCDVSDMRSAMVVFQEMRMKGFTPDGYTVEAMIVGFCEEREVCRALDFFELAVKSLGYWATQRTYSVLVKGLLEDGRVRDAVKLKEEMVGMGLSPSPDIQRVFLENQNLFLGDKIKML